MIFVTLGSQKFPFNRLLKAVDDLCLKEEVFAQTGASDYIPRNYGHKPYLDREEFAAVMARADVVITHGGTGAIIGAVKMGKKVIAVPRLARYGEHVDDHQLQLVSQFRDLNLICECDDAGQIGKALETVRRTEYAAYVSNTRALLDDISDYIERECN